MAATFDNVPLTSPVPLNGCPHKVRDVCNFVAVPAFAAYATSNVFETLPTVIDILLSEVFDKSVNYPFSKVSISNLVYLS